MEWVDGGLRNVTGKAQANATDSHKLFNTIMPTGAFTVEAWITPANTTQTGPARIVSYSSGHGHEQFPDGPERGPLSVPQSHAPRAMRTAIRSSKRPPPTSRPSCSTS